MVVTNLTREAVNRYAAQLVGAGHQQRALEEWAAIERALEELEGYQRAEKEGRLLLVKPGYAIQSFVVAREGKR
jgi:hypothetical protein